MKLTTLVLGGLLAVSSAFGYETDMNKYIPAGEQVYIYDFEQFKLILWDRNKDRVLQENEIFFDLNKDGIPDFSYKELLEEYNQKLNIVVESKNV